VTILLLGPDGKHIAHVTITDGTILWYATRRLAIAASTGGETEVLTKTLDRNISKPKFSKTEIHLFFSGRKWDEYFSFC
jgi:hypothetical protein